MFDNNVQSNGRDKAINSYRASITDLRSKLSERRRIERMLRLPRTADWLPIDMEIEEIENTLATTMRQVHRILD